MESKLSNLRIAVLSIDESGIKDTYIGEVNIQIPKIESLKIIKNSYDIINLKDKKMNGQMEVVLYYSQERSANDFKKELEKDSYKQFFQVNFFFRPKLVF